MQKANKSKKFILIFIAFVLAMAMCACGDDEPQPEPELEIVDETAPVVEGRISSLYIKRGENPSSSFYLEGLSWSDETSEKANISIKVIDSDVDYFTNGIYIAYVEFADEAGNVAKVSRSVAVYTLDVNEITELPYDETLDEMLQEIMDEIITEDMDIETKVHTIYNWMDQNLRYKADRDYSFLDEIDEVYGEYAINLLSDRQGACFAYAVVFNRFMNKLNVPTILVIGDGASAEGGYTLHCWNMIQLGDSWTHCDPMYEQLYVGDPADIHFWMKPSSYLYDFTHMWDTNEYPWE